MTELPSRYERRRLLGEGGMGQVHLVLDREADREVALKTLRLPANAEAAEEARFLFKQEFWAMASLRHPNLVEGFDFGELADGTPYLTMEPVPGRDLAVDAPLPEAEVRAWLPGIAAALAFLHARGYIHGDLKPENIRIREDGLPKLMDLGLLTRAGRAGGAVRGSLHYLAPELARQGAVDARTDLYGLGAVLYHALAGRPVFDPEFTLPPVELLRAQIDARPEPLSRFAPGVSREMEQAVMRLLEKDPARRHASALEFLAAIGLAAEGEEAIGLLGAPLIGRDDVKAEVQRALTALQPTAVWLVGGPGAGKTRLLAEVRAEAQLRGLTTFLTSGLGADGSPYQALRPWLKALAATTCSERDRLAPVLARILPEIGRLCGLPELQPAPALEGSQEKLRLHAAVTELAIAAAPAAAWLIDDADQLDPASRELLEFMRARGGARAWRWVFTAGGAAGAAGGAAGAGQEVQTGTDRALVLAPLDENETLTMAGALLGQDNLPGPVIERLPALTAGNPGMIEAVVGHWLRSGALVRIAGRWETQAADKLDLPGGLQVVLDARFEGLGEDARRVGRTAALLGATGELPWLAGLVELPEGAFFAALAELEGAGVLVREDSAFRFVRPPQAQALAASWPEDEARRLHGAAARWLAGRIGDDPREPSAALGDLLAVANHHLAGDQPAEGLAWAIAASRRSMVLYAINPVEPLVRKALAVPNLPADAFAEMQEIAAHVMRFQGHVDEALALVEQDVIPHARATASPRLADHLVTLGVCHQMKGRYPQALAAYAEAINLADAAGDVSTSVRARIFAGRTAYFSGETGAAKTSLAAAVRRARAADEQALLAGALSLYGYVLASTDATQVSEGLAMLDESISINHRIDNLYELQEAHNNQGNVFLGTGRLSDAQRVFEKCLLLCERMASANEQIFAHLNLGAVLLELGRLADATAHARKAGDMSRKQGRKFPEAFTHAIEGLALIYQGELVVGIEHLDTGLRLAREIANRYLELNILAYRIEGLVHLGRFAQAESELAKARELAEAIQNDEQNAKLDRHAAALAVLAWSTDAQEKVLKVLEAARLQDQPVAIAHALRWQVARLLREQELDIAITLVAEAAELAAVGGLVLLGAELRELWGRLLLALDPAAAAERFAEGQELARDAGCRVVEILCQAGVGQASPAGRLDRLEAPRRLEALIEPLEEAERQDFLAWPERGAALRLGLESGDLMSADRIQHLTDLIALVTSQPDLPRVMQQALAALVEIAGAERGFLLLYNGFEVTQQIFHGMDERDNDDFSSGLAYQVLWTGEPLFVEDASNHTEFMGRQSVQSLSLRSVVAVPLNDGHETVGVMMADSQRINTRFTPQDLELAMALARQVAIAITNTRRLQRYQNAFDESQVLHQLALAMLGRRTVEEALAAVAAEALPLCGASRALLLAGPELGVQAAYDAAGQALPTAGIEVSHSVSGWVHESGEPLHLVDAQADEHFQSRASVMALGLHTIFAVPVAFEGRRLGVLYLDHPQIVDEDPAALHTLVRIGEMLGAFVSRAG